MTSTKKLLSALVLIFRPPAMPWAATGSLSFQIDTRAEDCAVTTVAAEVVLTTDDAYHWDVISWVGTRAQVDYYLDDVFSGTVKAITCGYFNIYLRCADGAPLGQSLPFWIGSGFPGLTFGTHTVSLRLMDVYGETFPYGQAYRIGDEIFRADLTVCMGPDQRQYLGPCGSPCVISLPDDGYNGDESRCPPEPDKVGNPVTVLTGNNFEHEQDIGFASPMADGFVFTRSYNSRSDRTGPVGHGWTHGYNLVLTPTYEHQRRTYLKIEDETGRGVYFERQETGAYEGAFGERSTVVQDNDQYTWRRPDGTVYRFDATGRLLRIQDRYGNARDLTYDDTGRLHTVLDTASNRQMTMLYDDLDRIVAVTGPVTEAVPDGIWVQYAYDDTDNLITVTYPDGTGFAYAYEDADPHNLTEKRDGAGRFLSAWTYDDQDRAIANTPAEGPGLLIEYPDETTVRVTDAGGQETVYTIDEVNGRKRIGQVDRPEDCAACGQGVTGIDYDASGQCHRVGLCQRPDGPVCGPRRAGQRRNRDPDR